MSAPPDCTPVVWCAPPAFSLAFPDLVGPTGPPGGAGAFVENFAALRLIDASAFPDSYMAYVGGHDTLNDGGGGMFFYDTASLAADNDGTIISPANGFGRWFRVYTGAVIPQWFGAKGDGVANDGPKIVAAAANSDAVYFPEGTYRVIATIAPVHGRFYSREGAVIAFTATGSLALSAVVVDIDGITFHGPMTGDQYALGIDANTISTAFDTPTYQNTAGADIALDFTAAKAGAQLTVGTAGLTGNLTRSVTSDYITLDPTKRYVWHAIGKTADSYGGLQDVTFRKYDALNNYLGDYVPSDSSTFYSFLAGAAKVKIRITVAHFADMPTGLASVVNIFAFGLLELVNESATFALVTSPQDSGYVVCGNCASPSISNCRFAYIDKSSALFINCNDVFFDSNEVSYSWTGVNVTTCERATVTNNTIDLRQKNGGISSGYNLKALRLRCVSGTDTDKLIIAGNTLIGASWGIEVVQGLAKRSVVTGNTVSAEYLGISLASGTDNVVADNVVQTVGALTYACIEIAGTNTRPMCSTNTIKVLNPLSVGYGVVVPNTPVQGSISNNNIEAPVGMFTPGNSPLGPVMKGNEITWKACGIYTQTAFFEITDNHLRCYDNMGFFKQGAGIVADLGSVMSLISNNHIDVFALPAFQSLATVNLRFVRNFISLLAVVPVAIRLTGGAGCDHVYQDNTLVGSAPTDAFINGSTGTFIADNNRLNENYVLIGEDLWVGGQRRYRTTSTAATTHQVVMALGEGTFELTLTSRVGGDANQVLTSRWWITALDPSTNDTAVCQQIGTTNKSAGSAIVGPASVALSVTAPGVLTVDITTLGGGVITMTHTFDILRLHEGGIP